jgi:hypothetical protein
LSAGGSTIGNQGKDPVHQPDSRTAGYRAPGLASADEPLGTVGLIQALSRLRPGTHHSSPAAATKLALRSLARRHKALSDEIRELDTVLDELTATAAPGLLAGTGVGTEVAGQLLVIAGDNPRAAAFGGLLCSSGRRCSHPGIIGTHQPPPAQPRRRSGREQGTPHRRGCPAEIRRTYPRLCPSANRRRTLDEKTSCDVSNEPSPARCIRSSRAQRDSQQLVNQRQIRAIRG